MPIFKKSHSDNDGSLPLSENYRKVLHRCRMVIIKDVDVADIMDNYLAQEDGFKPEVRDHILSFTAREQRTGVFLDKLETRGDRAFGLFMEALREKYKHLAFIVEENIKAINEDSQAQQKDRSSISGDRVRKLLANNQRRKMEYSHGSESVDDLDYIFDEKMDDEYIDCYSIPMRGKLQKDTWVKYVSTPKAQLQPEPEEDTTYMGTLCRDLLFRKVPIEDIPEGVKKPPVTCSCFLLDRDNKYGLRRPSHMFQARALVSVIDRKRFDKEKDSTLLNLPQAPAPPQPKSPNHRHAHDPLPPQPDEIPSQVPPAPPVPPKPGALSPVNIASRGVQEKHVSIPEPKLPPRTSVTTVPIPPAPNGSVPTPPLSRPESLSDPLLPLSPIKATAPEKSLPPEPAVQCSAPTPPPHSRHRSGSASSPEPAAPPIPPRVNAPLSPEPTLNKPPPPAKAESRAGSQPPESLGDFDDSFECDESLMSKQIPAPDDTEEDSSAQTLTDSNMVEPDDEEDYEAIGQPPMTMSPPTPLVNGAPSSARSSRAEASRESTPDELDNSHHDVSSKASADSLDSSLTPGSIGKSSTTDSGVEAVTSLQIPFLQARETTVRSAIALPPMPFPPQKQWPDVQILANDDSSDNDSYYEDIDALDERKSYKGSVAYLDPKSQRTMDRGRGSISGARSASMKKHIEDLEFQGSHVFLKTGELMITEEGIACNIPEPFAEETDAFSDEEEGQVEAEEEIDTVDKTGPDEEQPEEAKVHRCPSVKRTVAALEAAAKASSEPVKVEEEKQEENKFEAAAKVSSEPAKVEEVKIEEKKVDIKSEPRPTKLDPHCDFRNTLLAYDKGGRAFYIPVQYLKRHGDPENEVWFYPLPMSSRQATLFLSAEKQEGCFVVYKPSNSLSDALYNLSVCRANGDVLHYPIIENVHGDLMVRGHDHSFMNIIELVSYFKQNKSNLATKLQRPLKEAKMPITPGYHYELRYELNRSSLSLSSNIIGKGNFGVVCSGVYQNNMPVAVKVLQKADASMQEEDDFIEEAKTMMGLKHDHIIHLIGVSCTAKPFFLVTEFVPKGNLKNCLRKQEISTESLDIMFDICIQVTSAMFYLESQSYILHRDVAARNFLVAQDLCIKLADFGRARTVTDDNYQAPKNEKIAVKWAAPEVLVHSTHSTKSDVWALGVTYWEIFSGGEQPFSSLAGEQVAIYVTEGGRLEKPHGCPPDLFGVMKSCWRDHPDDRPSFAQLCENLKSKSSIYYSPANTINEKLRRKPQQLPALPRDPALPREKTPTTPVLTKKQRQKAATLANSKMRRSATGDMKVELGVREDASIMSNRSGENRIPTSSSETSLTSTVFERDDLTRGDKIRKSLRKMISMKPKRKPSNVKDLQGTRHSVPISAHYDDYGDQY